MAQGNDKVRIIIADPQFLIVESLKSILLSEDRFSVTAVVSSKTELLKALIGFNSGLLITDFALIDYPGIAELKEIIFEHSGVFVLILTNSVTKSEFTELTSLGFKDIIYKTADREEIFAAIDLTLKGKMYYSEEILDLLTESGNNKQMIENPGRLTASEIEIVKLIASGLTAKEIALKRHISFHTVNTHRKNIFRKLGVSNSSELIMLAIKSGWIDNIEYYI
jgi:DNA-binding NarL/FixJ family response regulator